MRQLGDAGTRDGLSGAAQLRLNEDYERKGFGVRKGGGLRLREAKFRQARHVCGLETKRYRTLRRAGDTRLFSSAVLVRSQPPMAG